MRREYVKPVMDGEEFVANEYVAVCYIAECNIEQGNMPGTLKDNNGNVLSNEYNHASSCPETHVFKMAGDEEPITNGIFDKNNGGQGPFNVFWWQDDSGFHCSTTVLHDTNNYS